MADELLAGRHASVGSRLEDHDRADVHVRAVVDLLELEEGGVDRCEMLAHKDSPPRPVGCRGLTCDCTREATAARRSPHPVSVRGAWGWLPTDSATQPNSRTSATCAQSRRLRARYAPMKTSYGQRFSPPESVDAPWNRVAVALGVSHRPHVSTRPTRCQPALGLRVPALEVLVFAPTSRRRPPASSNQEPHLSGCGQYGRLHSPC